MTRNCPRFLILALIAAMLISCGAPPSNPITPDPEVKQVTQASLPELPPESIARHPEPTDMRWTNAYTTLPKYDPNSTDPRQIDLRSAYLVKLDLSKNFVELLHSDFDSQTKWPPADKMPAGFDPQIVMQIGKDPGLGVRFLHEKGITGTGVGIAIIDQTLLVDHVEYVDRIQTYEEAEDVTGGWLQTSMHGPAVASIAAGKSVGVAPGADLYFIATGGCSNSGQAELDFSCLAKDVLRVVEINKGLPVNRKIRVLSISTGWMPQYKGYDAIMEAVKQAKAAGIFVVSVSLNETYGWNVLGMGRNALADPNQFDSFLPGAFWAQYFYNGKPILDQTLLVPMDARTTASPTGVEDYVYYGDGGMSWAVPYLAGMYALAAQVKPDITPEEFWASALLTGQTIKVQHGLKSYSLGVILDPQALIAELQK